MFKNIRKGFTIVELVIVIAVIAILAGVLIPTFSSVTKNAKKSAAQQQAKNGMESILALTGGSYPDGTDFLVSDSAKADGAKLDYWFAYAGNKLVEAEGNSNPGGKAVSPYSDANTYAVYFSSKCFEADNITSSVAYKVSLKLLDDATADDLTGFAFSGTAQDGYYTLTKKVGEVTTTYKIYFSSDIEPTLVIVLGQNYSTN